MVDTLSIVHVVRQFLPNRGGLEDVVFHLCREQLKEGFDARVVTLDRLFSNPGLELAAEETIDGIKVTRVPFHGSSRYPLAPRALLQVGQADLIHVHGIDFFFDALAITRFFHRTPLIATTHGGFFHTQDHSRLKRLWFNGPTRLSAKIYDAIVACSPSDEEMFRKIAAGRVHLIENGVDIEKYAGSASLTPAKRLVSLGRFSKNKRPERLIAAMAALKAMDAAWHLDLVGVESDWSAVALQALIEAAGVAPNVTLHIGLDTPAVAELMRRASFFVSASTFEGFGLALIEAMSAGLVPVVQANAAFEALGHKHPSIQLTDFAEAEAAAKVIARAFDGLGSGQAHVRPIQEELVAYGWSRAASAYAELYRSILPTTRRAQRSVEAAAPIRHV